MRPPSRGAGSSAGAPGGIVSSSETTLARLVGMPTPPPPGLVNTHAVDMYTGVPSKYMFNKIVVRIRFSVSKQLFQPHLIFVTG